MYFKYIFPRGHNFTNVSAVILSPLCLARLASPVTNRQPQCLFLIEQTIDKFQAQMRTVVSVEGFSIGRLPRSQQRTTNRIPL